MKIKLDNVLFVVYCIAMINKNNKRKDLNMDAQTALRDLCYTSERTWEGDIYTISDFRHPEYNGRQIMVTLEYGKNVITWIN